MVGDLARVVNEGNVLFGIGELEETPKPLRLYLRLVSKFILGKNHRCTGMFRRIDLVRTRAPAIDLAGTQCPHFRPVKDAVVCFPTCYCLNLQPYHGLYNRLNNLYSAI